MKEKKQQEYEECLFNACQNIYFKYKDFSVMWNCYNIIKDMLFSLFKKKSKNHYIIDLKDKAEDSIVTFFEKIQKYEYVKSPLAYLSFYAVDRIYGMKDRFNENTFNENTLDYGDVWEE
jgi:hypothetical protein